MVQSPKGWEQIEFFHSGDPISVASASGAGWTWTTSPVVFASDGGPQERYAAYIRFAEGELVVSVDQPMMTEGGVLKPANTLDPEKDSLIGLDGSAVPLISIALGMFRGLFYAPYRCGHSTANPPAIIYSPKSVPLTEQRATVRP